MKTQMPTRIEKTKCEIRGSFPVPEFGPEAPAVCCCRQVRGGAHRAHYGGRGGFGSCISPFVFCAPLAAALMLLSSGLSARAGSIVTSKHNLSVQGPGSIRAASESEVCIFCHTPHRAMAEGPLWNHQLSQVPYDVYQSSSLKAIVGQPNGASRLCLSCHDGTVAIGMLHNQLQPVTMRDGVTIMPSGSANLGTDLANDHPISFRYDNGLASANGQLRNPGTLDPRVRMDRDQLLQCTACHDPHNDQYSKFLVLDDRQGELCLACHTPPLWGASVHATSSKGWNGTGQDPWPHTEYGSVADNACANCHATHGAGTARRLLNFQGEEENCYSCHSGTVAAKNVAADFSKLSIHPVDSTSNVHDPMEDVVNPPRHVECMDCHNSHSTRDQPAVAPNISGALVAVKGVNSSGTAVQAVTREYELCFRCHADSVSRGPARVPRQFVQTNTRLEFAQSNPSYHPVVAPGKQTTSPSLIPPWTTASYMYCTDCHNSDQSPGAGGVGANGPHGSIHTPILERQLVLADFNAENAGTYALCYKCHSRTVVTAENDNSWRYHRKHVVEEQAACTTCHDPHGVQQNAHLINFNTTYVSPNGGVLRFNDGAVGNRSCTLTCHGKPHDTGMNY